MTDREPIHLSGKEQEIVQQLVDGRDSELALRLARLGLGALDPASLQSLEDMISDEFSSTGRQENSEPNPRGIVLEHLLDAVLKERLRIQES